MTTKAFHDRLTPDNAAVLLVDHQVGLYSGVRDISLQDLKHNVTGLAKAAQVFGMPLVVTTTAAQSMWGPLIPELTDVLPDSLEVVDRSSVNAWDDERIRDAVAATGRTKLIISGISLEVCAAFPAIAALADGYDTYVTLDASGTFWQAKREAGLLRMQQAGVIVSDYSTLMVEALADNANPLAADVYAALDMPFAKLVGQIASAYTK
ncbi:isochorismatase family protein [Actinocrispum sp. NPDC049592]|uniref:isochorismatase family protein n=1 Tax=Actinocrispum sp. NPDC049592 TaxID=3154835 RepID=UPI00343D4D99